MNESCVTGWEGSRTAWWPGQATPGQVGFRAHLRCQPARSAHPLRHAFRPGQGHRPRRPPVPNFRHKVPGGRFGDENVVAFDVPVDDGRLARVQVEHAVGDVQTHGDFFQEREVCGAVVEEHAQGAAGAEFADDPDGLLCGVLSRAGVGRHRAGGEMMCTCVPTQRVRDEECEGFLDRELDRA